MKQRPPQGWSIGLKNGLLTKEHHDRIGEALWEFAWLVDKITNEKNGTGVVLGGRPIKLKEFPFVGPRQTERRLNQLRNKGYINIKRASHGLIITVNKSKKWGLEKQITDSPDASDVSHLRDDKSVASNRSDTSDVSHQGEDRYDRSDVEIRQICPSDTTDLTSRYDRSDGSKKTIQDNTKTIQRHYTKTNKVILSSKTERIIFDFWNEQKIVVHRKLTDKTRTKIRAALKDYSLEELKSAIHNYAFILHGDEYWWTHVWTLRDFLMRGVEKFLDIEIAKVNYRIRASPPGKKTKSMIKHGEVLDAERDFIR